MDTRTKLLRVFRVPIIAALLLSSMAFVIPAHAQTADCRIMPAAFEVYGYNVMPTQQALDIEATDPNTLVGAKYDFNVPGSGFYQDPIRVPLRCVTFPGGSPMNYALMTQMTTFVTRLGNDPGSQTGVLARGLVILHAHSGVHSTIQQEFEITRQRWEDFISSDGHYLFGVKQPRGDIRWVLERELLSNLTDNGVRGRTYGQRGRSVPPVATPVPVAAPVSATPVVMMPAPPSTTDDRVNTLERRLAGLEVRFQQAEAKLADTDGKLDKIIEILTTPPAEPAAT